MRHFFSFVWKSQSSATLKIRFLFYWLVISCFRVTRLSWEKLHNDDVATKLFLLLPRIELGVFTFSMPTPSWLPLLLLFNPTFVLIVDEDDEAFDADGIEMAVGGGVVLSTRSGPVKQSVAPCKRFPPELFTEPKAPPFNVLNNIVPWGGFKALVTVLLQFTAATAKLRGFMLFLMANFWFENAIVWPALLLLSRDDDDDVEEPPLVVKLLCLTAACCCWRKLSRYNDRLSIDADDVESRGGCWDTANLLGVVGIELDVAADIDPRSDDVISLRDGWCCWWWCSIFRFHICVWKKLLKLSIVEFWFVGGGGDEVKNFF